MYINPLWKTRVATTTAFGRLLRQYRDAAGISQETLAIRAGITHSYVSRMETGNREPSIDTVNALIDALALNRHQALRLYEASGVLDDIREALAKVPADVRDNLLRIAAGQEEAA